METFKTIDDLVGVVEDALKSHHVINNDVITFPIEYIDNYGTGLEVTEDYLQRLLIELSQMNEVDETTIMNENNFEMLVSDKSSLSRLRMVVGDELILRDEENKLTYKLSKPSDCFLVFLLYKLNQIAPIRYSFDYVYFRFLSHKIGTDNDKVPDKNVFNILRRISPRLLTLRIVSEHQQQENDFVKFANSFFFQLSFNLDLPIVPQRYLDDLVRRGRITRVRRISLNELEPPKRFYLHDLIYHYQLAVASDSPPLGYLSYYHVLEYFFESVFNDDLILKVTKKITDPDFSYKRKKDVKKLIDQIGASLKFKGENVTFSEIDALRLTLERYIDIGDLIEKIKGYDKTLIEYFRNEQVRFSNGDTFDIESEDISKVFRLIASRIYKTRNAIVHSKESERSRYIPFDHDKILYKELPLLRFIAELVILDSSTIID